MTQPEPLMSIEQVAEYLNVPVKTIYAWRTAGRGPRAFRVGKHLRFRRADVEAWVSQQTSVEHAKAIEELSLEQDLIRLLVRRGILDSAVDKERP